MFETLVIGLLEEASIKAVAGWFRISWNAVDGMMFRAVDRGLHRRKRALPQQISVDET